MNKGDFMKKKIVSILLCCGIAATIAGCDNNKSSNSVSISQERSYPSDNLKIAELMSNKNNVSQQERDKDVLNKINFDELMAINIYINSLNGQPIPPGKTVKEVAQDFNILNPQSPVLRGPVQSFYDYFYRDLFIMMLQNQGDPKIIGDIKNCLMFNKSEEIKNVIDKKEKSMDGMQIGYMQNACYPENKVKYQNIGEINTSGSNDGVIIGSQEFKDKILNAKTPEELKKGMDSLDINADELLVVNGLMPSLSASSTVKDAVIMFNNKYPGAPVIRGGLDKNNAYVRDLDLLKKTGNVSQTDIDMVNQCINKLSETVYPYTELKKMENPQKVSLNIPLAKINKDCSLIK